LGWGLASKSRQSQQHLLEASPVGAAGATDGEMQAVAQSRPPRELPVALFGEQRGSSLVLRKVVDRGLPGFLDEVIDSIVGADPRSEKERAA